MSTWTCSSFFSQAACKAYCSDRCPQWRTMAPVCWEPLVVCCDIWISGIPDLTSFLTRSKYSVVSEFAQALPANRLNRTESMLVQENTQPRLLRKSSKDALEAKPFWRIWTSRVTWTIVQHLNFTAQLLSGCRNLHKDATNHQMCHFVQSELEARAASKIPLNSSCSKTWWDISEVLRWKHRRNHQDWQVIAVVVKLQTTQDLATESFSGLRQRISWSVRLQEKSSDNTAYSIVWSPDFDPVDWNCMPWMVCVKVMLTLAQVPGQRRVKLVWHLQQLSPFHSCKHQVWIHHDPSWSMVIHSIQSPSLCWAWCIEQSADPRRQFCRSIVAKTSETWAVWTVWFMIIMCVFERRLHRQPLVARHPIPCHRCQGSSGESSNFADVDLGFLPPLLLAWLGCTCQLFNTTCKHVWRNAASNRRWSHGLHIYN